MQLKPYPMWNEPEPWTRPTPLPGPIETDRLIVRLAAPDDGDRLHEALTACGDGLLPWMAWSTPENRSLQACRATIERFTQQALQEDCPFYMMLIIERATGLLVGGTDIRIIAQGWRNGEVGYWTRPDRQRRGYATEAIGALVSSGLTHQSAGGWGLRRIVIECAGANRPSQRIAERLGFRLECHKRNERWLDGLGYHDSLGYAVLAEEWDFTRHRGPGSGPTQGGPVNLHA